MPGERRPDKARPGDQSRAATSPLPHGTLGPLETEIMHVVWGMGPVTTREVYSRLLQRRDIAYTTVMTVMGNLTKKKLLERRLEGRAYVYQATVTREELTHSRVAEVMGTLLDRFTGPAVTSLIDRLGTIGEARLTELESEIARLRRRQAARPEASAEPDQSREGGRS